LSKDEYGERRQIITWGEDGRLLLSMGMSSDFEAALKAVAILYEWARAYFGERPQKDGTN